MKEEEADKFTVERQFIEEEKKRKSKIKVRIETINKGILIGYLYLDKGVYRRISDFLNDADIDFIVLTEAKDLAKEGEANYPFVAINKRHMVMISEI